MVGGLLLLGLAPLEARADLDLFLAADGTGFHYEEYLRDDSLFNREYGILPGVRLSLQAGTGAFFTRMDITAHVGDINYWSPANGDSTTHTHFLTVAANAGAWIGDRQRWGAYFHAARRIWDRDIEGTFYKGIYYQGLYEQYRWTELGFGLRHRWPASLGGNWRHQVSAMAFAVTNGSIFVDLSELNGSSWEDATLDLGDNAGLRLRYTATRDYGAWTLRLEPYFEVWGFGRSNTEPVMTTNGQPAVNDEGRIITVTEPRSISMRAGIAAGWLF